MSKLFICYRREDSGPAAGRIYDRLESHFARGQVFMDVDDIPLGVDFRDWLDRQIRQCDLVLVVMNAIQADTSDAVRALRGGSWYFHPLNARAGVRGQDLPVDRDDDRGFWLLSSVPIDADR